MAGILSANPTAAPMPMSIQDGSVCSASEVAICRCQGKAMNTSVRINRPQTGHQVQRAAKTDGDLRRVCLTETGNRSA